MKKHVFEQFPTIILFRFLLLSFLIRNNRFGEISLMDLSLAWSSKFNTSFFLERSQEDASIHSGRVSLWKNVARISISLTYYAFICIHVCEGYGCIKKLLIKFELKLLNKTFLSDCSIWRLS